MRFCFRPQKPRTAIRKALYSLPEHRPFLAAGAFDFLLREAVAVFFYPGALCSEWPGGGGSSIVPRTINCVLVRGLAAVFVLLSARVF